MGDCRAVDFDKNEEIARRWLMTCLMAYLTEVLSCTSAVLSAGGSSESLEESGRKRLKE
jgi:hypothetical protein